MILKVRREQDNQEWWILDEIRKVSVSKVKEVYSNELSAPGGLGYDITLLDRIVGRTTEPHHYVVLCCRRTDNEEFTIAFDTYAYLCNDEGKTIEKIMGS